MDANEIVARNGIQHDASGVGYCWRVVHPADMPADVVEEIASWIIEDDPSDGDQVTASNGQTYRMPIPPGVDQHI